MPTAAEQQLRDVLDNFEGRHRNLLQIFETRADQMEDALDPHAKLDQTQRRLIGSYFLNEYSFEASALFNPSIVRHPDQSELSDNCLPFYPEPARSRRRAYLVADIPLRHHRRRRQHQNRRYRASRLGTHGQVAHVGTIWRRSRSRLSARRGIKRARYLSDYRRTDQRHRRRALCRIHRRQRRAHLLCDLHRL